VIIWRIECLFYFTCGETPWRNVQAQKPITGWRGIELEVDRLEHRATSCFHGGQGRISQTEVNVSLFNQSSEGVKYLTKESGLDPENARSAPESLDLPPEWHLMACGMGPDRNRCCILRHRFLVRKHSNWIWRKPKNHSAFQ
jgi:hypothetical protein